MPALSDEADDNLFQSRTYLTAVNLLQCLANQHHALGQPDEPHLFRSNVAEAGILHQPPIGVFFDTPDSLAVVGVPEELVPASS